MHPVVRAALAASALSAMSALGSAAPVQRTITLHGEHPEEGQEDTDLSALCPEGQLPDFDRCTPIPQNAPSPSLEGQSGAHRLRDGAWRIYEQIPRRPDRPADYLGYRYPIEPPAQGGFVLSPYDLDRPDPEQRRGMGFSSTGHGGLDLAQGEGTPVRVVTLDNQDGDAQVVFVGRLFGNTVATRHTVREAGRPRDYLLIHGHLQASRPGLLAGTPIREGEVLGFVGDSGSEGNVHLHLEVRQVRDLVDPALLRSQSLIQSSVSIPCDPRNVLPRKLAP